MIAVTTTTNDESTNPPRRWLRALALAALVAFVVFWAWVFLFASKEAVNRIEDRAWAERAAARCLEATEARYELINLTRVDQAGPELIRQRADIVDESTDILDRMLTDIVAVEPFDEKGQAIVPQWEADYRIYLEDRRTYARQLRESGENLPFYETATDGIPISERIATFAGDNEMSECSPPLDLTR